jgi:hypothetical protein
MKLYELIAELEKLAEEHSDKDVEFHYTEYGCCDSSDAERDVEEAMLGYRREYKVAVGPRGGKKQLRAVQVPVIVLC